RQAETDLAARFLVVPQQCFVIALEVLNVEIAVHVQEGTLQRPRGLELGAVVAAPASPVQTGEHQTVILSPAQFPVDVAHEVLVIGVVAGAEVLLQARGEGEGAAMTEAVTELRLNIHKVQRTRIIATLAVRLVFHPRLLAQEEGTAIRAEHGILAPENARLE